MNTRQHLADAKAVSPVGKVFEATAGLVLAMVDSTEKRVATDLPQVFLF